MLRHCLLIPFLAAFPTAAATHSAVTAPNGIHWCTSTEVATGGGLHGEWRQNESRYDYVDDPTVAIDARGRAAVAWVDQRRKDVFFQIYERNGRARLKVPVNVSRTPTVFSWVPRIALSPNTNDIYILWQEIVFSGGSHGGDIFFASSRDGGATFDAPLNLSGSIGGDGKGRINKDVWHNGSLDIAVDASGVIYAAWTEYDGPLWFSRSTDRGVTFSRPMQLARGDDKPTRAPALAPRADGTVYLVWTVGGDESADLRIATSTDAGRSFTAPRVIAQTPGYSDAPKIAVDSKGTLHIAYAESVAGPFERYHVRFMRSRDGGKTFEAARDISSPQVAPNPKRKPAAAAFPHLALDGKDNVYVLWEVFPGKPWPSQGLALTVSRDGGGSFDAPVMIDERAPNGGRQGLLMRKLAVNAGGEIAIVNSTFKDGEASRVWLARAAAAGCVR